MWEDRGWCERPKNISTIIEKKTAEGHAKKQGKWAVEWGSYL